MARSLFNLAQVFAVLVLAALASLINAAAPGTSACDKACKVAGAQAYVAAVISHADKDINRIPMADNITRFEKLNGGSYALTANGTKSLKQSLKFGNTAFFVTGSAEPDRGLGNYTVLRNGTVVADYKIKAGLLGIGFVTSTVHERFDYTTTGLIYNITAEATA
ncbi:hypothetical protein OC835_001387 [Tilletia horrida]|nr:hypothetical protein OC835_001387 [Tilletia horrida]